MPLVQTEVSWDFGQRALATRTLRGLWKWRSELGGNDRLLASISVGRIEDFRGLPWAARRALQRGWRSAGAAWAHSNPDSGCDNWIDNRIIAWTSCDPASLRALVRGVEEASTFPAQLAWTSIHSDLSTSDLLDALEFADHRPLGSSLPDRTDPSSITMVSIDLNVAHHHAILIELVARNRGETVDSAIREGVQLLLASANSTVAEQS